MSPTKLQESSGVRTKRCVNLHVALARCTCKLQLNLNNGTHSGCGVISPSKSKSENVSDAISGIASLSALSTEQTNNPVLSFRYSVISVGPGSRTS